MYEQYTDKQIVEMLMPKLAKPGWGSVVSDDLYPDTIEMIATIYRLAYIRGQLGQSFIIGEKEEKGSNIVFQVGDSVKLINKMGVDTKDNRYFPPIGTIGEVTELGSDYCFVQWPHGTTEGNGIWACPKHCLKKVIERWVPVTPINEDEVNITVGSKVRYLNAEKHKQNPKYYPVQGTIGEVVSVSDNGTCFVQWPGYKTVWCASKFHLEVLLCE